MKNFTPELIAKAKAVSTVDELLAIAKENDIELTEDEAKIYFAQLNANGAVSDEELDLVAGGCGETYQDGDIVKFFDGTTCSCGCSTCRICYAPNRPYGAYLRCTNCQTIVFDQLPYDRFSKI